MENKIIIETEDQGHLLIVGLINSEVQHGCPISCSLLNLYIDDVMYNGQMNLLENFTIGNSAANELFVDD